MTADPMSQTLSPPEVILIGGGGHAYVVTEALRLAGRSIAGYVAPRAGAADCWLGGDEKLPDLVAAGYEFALATGFVNAAGAARRAAIIAVIPADRLVTVRHPAAIVSDTAFIGAGSAILAGAVVSSNARIELGAIVNSGAIVEHDCVLGPNSHAATGCCMAGNVLVGRDSLIGAGAVIRQGIVIGDGAVIGAGSVVLRDVPDRAMVFGNPARSRI